MSDYERSYVARRQAKPKTTRKRTEGNIQAKVVEYLELLGCLVLRTNAGAIEIAPGQWFHGIKEGGADLHCCTPHGCFLAVETKAPKKGLRPKQQEYRQRVEALNGTYITCSSVEALKTALVASYGPQRVASWEAEGQARLAAKRAQREALMKRNGQK